MFKQDFLLGGLLGKVWLESLPHCQGQHREPRARLGCTPSLGFGTSPLGGASPGLFYGGTISATASPCALQYFSLILQLLW